MGLEKGKNGNKKSGGFRKESRHKMYCSILIIIEILKRKNVGSIENKGIFTVRTFKYNRFIMLFTGNKSAGADRTFELSISAIVIVEVVMGSTAAWTYHIRRDALLVEVLN